MAARDLQLDQAPPARRMAVVSNHADRLEQIVRQQGWPRASVVGESGSEAAWLIAQHAPRLDQQQFFVEALARAAVAGEASPAHLAELKDRMLVRQGQPQIYGTQFYLADGQPVRNRVADPEELSSRRALMGLGDPTEDAERISSRLRSF